MQPLKEQPASPEGLLCHEAPTVWRDVEVAQRKGHHLVESRYRDQLSPVRSLRIVYGNQHHVFRAGGRSEPYKGGHVLVAVGSCFRVHYLRGPRLAGHAVTGDLGEVARPVVDDALQHPAYYSRGPFAYHPGALSLGGLLFRYMRRNSSPTVDERGVTRDELQRRYGKALSERDIADRNPTPVLVCGDESRVLIPQVHAGWFAEAEGANVVVELFPAELFGDLRRTDVAGVLEHASWGQDLCLVRLGIVDDVAGHGHVIRDHELTRRRDRALLERRRDGESLEGRAWLVRIGKDAISLVFCGNVAELVVVVSRGVGQRQNRPVINAHDHADGVLGLALLDGLRQGFLQLLLHRGVHRQIYVPATLQGVVVTDFDPAEGLTVVSLVSEELAGEGPVRIDPDGIGDDCDALDTQGLHLGCCLRLDACGDDAVSTELAVRTTPKESGPHLLLGHVRLFAEHGVQLPGRRPRVFDLVRGCYHAGDLEASRELPSVGTHYAAAGRRGDRGRSTGLLLGEGPVTRVLREAYVHGPPTEKKYRHREHRRHHPQPPVAHGSPSFGGHRRRATRPGRAAGPPLAAERYDFATRGLRPFVSGARGGLLATANPCVARPRLLSAPDSSATLTSSLSPTSLALSSLTPSSAALASSPAASVFR